MNLQNWTNIAAIVGIVIALCQFYCSRKDNKNNNERQHSPDFYFTAPERCDRFGVGYCSGGDFIPKIVEDCSGANLIYLFNLVNCGRFAAKNVRFCILTSGESDNILKIADERWMTISYHSGFPANSQSGDMVPMYFRKGDLNIKSDDRRIFILLEFRSSYSRRRYKRVYECCIRDKIGTRIISNYDSENDTYDIMLSTNNEIIKSSASQKSSDIEIAKSVRQAASETAERLRGAFTDMGFNRPVVIHDIRLVGENEKSRWNIFRGTFARLRKKFTHIQNADDWLLDL